MTSGKTRRAVKSFFVALVTVAGVAVLVTILIMGALAGIILAALMIAVALLIGVWDRSGFKRTASTANTTSYAPAADVETSAVPARPSTKLQDTDSRRFQTGEFTLPELPDAHVPVVREYVHAGTALMLTLRPFDRPDYRTDNLVVHPAIFKRFATAEAAYLSLGYRAVSAAYFHKYLGEDSQLETTDGIGIMRAENEPATSVVPHVQARVALSRAAGSGGAA